VLCTIANTRPTAAMWTVAAGRARRDQRRSRSLRVGHRTQGTAPEPITCARAQARRESCLCRRRQSCKNWQQSPAPRPRQHRSESGRVRGDFFADRSLCGRWQLWVPRWRPPVRVLRKRGQSGAPRALWEMGSVDQGLSESGIFSRIWDISRYIRIYPLESSRHPM